MRRAIFTEEHASTGHVPKIRKRPAWATGMAFIDGWKGTVGCDGESWLARAVDSGAP
ncbi:MAG TPA: hypothetical protein VF135_04220 [Terriglobales bacterium]